MLSLKEAEEKLDYAEHDAVMLKAAQLKPILDRRVEGEKRKLQKLLELQAEFHTKFNSDVKLSQDGTEDIFFQLGIRGITL